MKLFYCDAFENAPKRLLNLVTGIGDTAIGVATIDTATYRVWSYATQADAEEDIDGTEVGVEEELDVETVIFDDLQTGNGWPSNQGDGYNFAFDLPAERLPEGQRWYRVEITLTPDANLNQQDFYIVWIVHTKPIASH